MKRYFPLLSIIFLISSLCSHAAILTGHENINETEMLIQRSDDQAIEVYFNFPGVETHMVNHLGEDFRLLTIEGEGVSGTIGAPEVPLITRFFAIPDRARVLIGSITPEYRAYQGIHPYPHQEYEYGNPTQDSNWELNPKYYRDNELFPQKWVRLGEPVILRDFRIIPVTISPIRALASTGEVQVLTGIQVELAFDDGPTTNIKSHHFDKIASSFAKLYKEKIANYDWVNPNGVEVKGSLLILYCNTGTVGSLLEPLAEWKQRRGYDTHLVPIANHASTYTAYGVIQSAYYSYDPPLEHVMLVGDAAGSFEIDCYSFSGGSSDHGYTTIEGNDDIADITIGRLSINSTTVLSTIVNKILYYEMNPSLTHLDWYKSAALVSGSASSGWSTIQVNHAIMDYLEEMDFTEIDTVWYTMGTAGIENWMINQFVDGISVFNFRGYIGMNGWYPEEILNVNNPYKLPFVMAITCGTGNFGSSGGADESEAFLRAGTPTVPKGGICGIGTATSGTHTRYNNTFNQGTWWGISQEGLTEQGPAMFRGKFELFDTYQYDWGAGLKYVHWNNLMGDPTTDLWLDIPQQTVVSHPDTIAVGTSSVTVTVEDASGIPLAERYVTLWKGQETYVGGPTDENGVFTSAVDILSAGELKITVTYHNDYPYLADVPVIQLPINPSFYSLTLNDDNTATTSGNNDGVANPSEIIGLNVDLKNFGHSVTATNVIAVLSCDDEYLTILESTTTYPNIAPNSVQQPDGQFLVELADNFPQDYTFHFVMNISTSEGDFTSAFDVVASSGQAYVCGVEVTGGAFNPGDTDDFVLSVFNIGEWDLEGVSGTVTTNDTMVTIIDGEATFGDIASHDVGDNSSNPLVIEAHSNITIGRRVRFMIHLSSANGQEQDVYFSMTCGEISASDPVGPDSYGYYCIDDTDMEYTHRPEYDWIEINPSFGGSGIWVPVPDYGGDNDKSARLLLPFSFPYYGVINDTITVCSNGWIAFGKHNNYNDFRNQPIPTCFGPPSGMLMPFWDNLKLGSGGVYEYYDQLDNIYIIEYSNVQHNSGGAESFQVIFYDPAYYPTPTGDGEIVFNYQVVTPVCGPYNDHDWWTTGIMNHDHTDGLEVCYWNNYNPGMALLHNGHTIKFTTNEPVKLAPVTNIEVTLTPTTTPIVIPPGGGSFDFQIDVINNDPLQTAIFDGWIMVELPDGSFYGPVLLKESILLSAGGSISRVLTQNVPGIAPAGDYTYFAYLGDYEMSEIYAEDSFDFSKSGMDNSAGGDWNLSGWDIDNIIADSNTPENYSLGSAHPNPFNPTTEISYALPEYSRITMEVYNTLGRKVATLIYGYQSAGYHTVVFDAKNLSSGIYFYTMKTDNYIKTNKMLLVK